MEGVGDKTTSEGHLISAAAFVQGGIQDPCDDACSICLELTCCKHECQRSSQCPVCWQSISLKDPTGLELLETVVQERSFRFNPPRNATIFRHPTLGDFELQNQAYFKCAYECFDRKQEEIANCVEHCSIPVVKSQQYFEGEMAQFQDSHGESTIADALMKLPNQQ
ncbi:hypothetical protein Bca101_066871 [Brassica carinata]